MCGCSWFVTLCRRREAGEWQCMCGFLWGVTLCRRREAGERQSMCGCLWGVTLCIGGLHIHSCDGANNKELM